MLDSAEKFKKVYAAYDVIGDPEKRRMYDAELRAGSQLEQEWGRSDSGTPAGAIAVSQREQDVGCQMSEMGKQIKHMFRLWLFFLCAAIFCLLIHFTAGAYGKGGQGGHSDPPGVGQ